MTNNLATDALIEEAGKIGAHKTKKDAVTAALDEYVRLRRQWKILDLFGTVDFEPSYDYKRSRNKKRR